MKKILFFVAVMVLLGAMAFAQQPVVAVTPFNVISGVSADDAEMITDVFFTRLGNRRQVNLVSRSIVEGVIREHDFQLEDWSNKDKTAELGMALNAEWIVQGNIRSSGGYILIIVQFYDIRTFEYKGGTDLRLSSVDEAYDNINQLIDSLIQTIGGGTANQTNRTYQIGDIGPAGGIVFYDKGAFSNGWRYLEAAPAETEFNGVQWGAYTASGGFYNYRDILGTGTTVGSGKRNTELIVERLRAWGETGRAAQLCASLNFDGYADWFLPSKDELDLMYRNLKQKGVGDFGDQYYWSSSLESNRNAWNQGFKFGNQDYELGLKNIRYSVRAVRAF